MPQSVEHHPCSRPSSHVPGTLRGAAVHARHGRAHSVLPIQTLYGGRCSHPFRLTVSKTLLRAQPPVSDSGATSSSSSNTLASIPGSSSRAHRISSDQDCSSSSSSNSSSTIRFDGSNGSSTSSNTVSGHHRRSSTAKPSRQVRGRFSRTGSQPTNKAAAAAAADEPAVDGLAWYEQSPQAAAARQTVADKKQAQNHQQAVLEQQQVDSSMLPAQSITSSSSSSSSSGYTTTVSSSSSSISSSGGRSRALSAELLSAGQVQQLQRYLDHMLEVNKSMNLTAIRDPEEAWQRHIEDSLALLPVIDSYCSSNGSSGSSGSSSSGSGRVRRIGSRAAAGDASSSEESSQPQHQEQQQQQQQQQQQLRVIDVGTGAGLPGMVLAIARPHWKVTLLDSLRKRCDFLQATADMLGLGNVTVVWARAEEGGRKPELRNTYDLAVARAVAELRVLSELCLPFVKPGGVWVAAKGANPQEEVAAARPALAKLGGKLQAVAPVESWAPEGQRTAVVVAKTGSTPAKYPRGPGTPSKKPL